MRRIKLPSTKLLLSSCTNHGRNVSVMTTPRVKHGDQFPHEVKLAIAQYARQADVARLARVSSSWNAPAEETLWRDLRIGAVPRGWEGWRSRLQALRTRPIRQKYLRTLTVPSSERSLQAMADLIELCRFTIIEIKQIDIVEPNVYRPRFAPYEAWALARAIDAVRVLPALTKLSLHLGETWEYDLHRALLSVPALVDLEVITYGIRELVVSVDARPTLRLRHLSRFALTSVRWEAGMKMVLAAAPPLTEVILDSRHDDDAYTVATGAMDKIIKCNTLSRLEVYDGDASGNVIAESGSASGAGGRRKLEQLQEFSLCHPVRQTVIPGPSYRSGASLICSLLLTRLPLQASQIGSGHAVPARFTAIVPMVLRDLANSGAHGSHCALVHHPH